MAVYRILPATLIMVAVALFPLAADSEGGKVERRLPKEPTASAPL